MGIPSTKKTRFTKGSRVEVQKRSWNPSSWQHAVIISGNGHTYAVVLEEDNFKEICRVPRMAIRPCPPIPPGIMCRWVLTRLPSASSIICSSVGSCSPSDRPCDHQLNERRTSTIFQDDNDAESAAPAVPRREESLQIIISPTCAQVEEEEKESLPPSEEQQGIAHRLEYDAYASVLQAFHARSPSLTWEEETLLSRLRKDLHISLDEYRSLLKHLLH